jgi:hypothetical protein
MEDRNWIRTFAVAVGIIGGIGSFVAGQVFALHAPDLSTYSYSSQMHYNWIAVLAGMVSTILTTALFLALANIFEQQQEAADETRALRNSIEAAQRQESPASFQKSESFVPAPKDTIAFAVPQTVYKGRIRCSNCGQEQNDDRAICWGCGAALKPPDSATPTGIQF